MPTVNTKYLKHNMQEAKFVNWPQCRDLCIWVGVSFMLRCRQKPVTLQYFLCLSCSTYWRENYNKFCQLLVTFYTVRICVVVHQHFRRLCCLHFQGSSLQSWRWRKHSPPKHWYLTTTTQCSNTEIH